MRLRRRALCLRSVHDVPALRFEEDPNISRNSFISPTPSAGTHTSTRKKGSLVSRVLCSRVVSVVLFEQLIESGHQYST